MPFPLLIPLITGLAGAGASIAGSAMSNKKQTQSSSTTTTLPDDLKGLQGSLLAEIMTRINNPAAGLEPFRTNALDRINRSYSKIPQRLTEQFAARGYERNGKMGAALREVEQARAGEIADVETDFVRQILSREDTALALGQNMVNAGRGSASTVTMPSNAAGAGMNAAGDALGLLSGLLMRR